MPCCRRSTGSTAGQWGAGGWPTKTGIAQLVLEHKVTTGAKSDGAEWTSTPVRVTAKGMAKLAQLAGEGRRAA